MRLAVAKPHERAHATFFNRLFRANCSALCALKFNEQSVASGEGRKIASEQAKHGCSLFYQLTATLISFGENRKHAAAPTSLTDS